MALKKVPRDTERFAFENANPKGKRTGDCVVRALSVAMRKSWDDVLDLLVEEAHRRKHSPLSKECYSKVLEAHGFVKQKQPRKWDNTKMLGSEFCEWLENEYMPSADIVAHVGGHHIVAVRWFYGWGFKIVDTWDSSNHGCVGNWWVR